MTDQVKITLQTLKEHFELEKKLQGKLLLMFDDEVSSLKGFQRLLALSRYATVFKRLWQLFTKQAIVSRETIMGSGAEILLDEDVPIEAVSDILSILTVPGAETKIGASITAAVRKADITQDKIDDDLIDEDRNGSTA